MSVAYQFKNAITLNGVDMLVTPCADPMEYEQPFDYTYMTAQDAIDGLENIVKNQEFDLDLETLVLVQVETIVITKDFSAIEDYITA